MPQKNLVSRAWLVSGAVAVGCWVAAAYAGLGLAIVPGVILLVWGIAVGTNWRGVADAFPTTSGIGPFTTTVSTPMIRLIFGGFTLFGTIFLTVGIVHLAR